MMIDIDSDALRRMGASISLECGNKYSASNNTDQAIEIYTRGLRYDATSIEVR